MSLEHYFEIKESARQERLANPEAVFWLSSMLESGRSLRRYEEKYQRWLQDKYLCEVWSLLPAKGKARHLAELIEKFQRKNPNRADTKLESIIRKALAINIPIPENVDALHRRISCSKSP